MVTAVSWMGSAAFCCWQEQVSPSASGLPQWAQNPAMIMIILSDNIGGFLRQGAALPATYYRAFAPLPFNRTLSLLKEKHNPNPLGTGKLSCNSIIHHLYKNYNPELSG